jgi:hypothetical protein
MAAMFETPISNQEAIFGTFVPLVLKWVRQK